jgi:hypothetical protein
MAGCVLRASGVAFPVDEFLDNSSFAPCAVWHKGELRSKSRSAHTDYGFNLVVSEAEDLPTQVKDTVEFLNQQRAELIRLTHTTGFDSIVLDFGICRRDVLAQFDHFPADLVRFAAEFGMSIELSQYRASGPEGQ